MSETPDISAIHSDTYKEIHVTGQVVQTGYDGLRLTVLHDVPDLTDTLKGDTFKVSKIIINRQIECTLYLPPQMLKAWARAFEVELKRYEQTYGRILSPEEVEQKHRDSTSRS